ncbi:MAG TPA: Lpg1974 family pore-forming outer membrane protein, partial [Caulobacteraceae bacterium]|nr:Lpg1974 family pore-forming outer membrane protein [Caulobacteraceae bacterium]
HTILDFEVGYDIGLGSLDSTVRVGLRHAEFQSNTWVTADARAHFFATEGWSGVGGGPQAPISIDQFDVDLVAQREFSGAGPTVAWDAELPLWGDASTGILDLEWSITGGVLFGKQEAGITGNDFYQSTQGFYDDTGRTWPLEPVGAPTEFGPPADRSSDITVPLVDLSLGLAYEVGRVKLGAGYRWERYFDVLDVGYDEEQSADRTIDGPYFKLAVGFGG